MRKFSKSISVRCSLKWKRKECWHKLYIYGIILRTNTEFETAICIAKKEDVHSAKMVLDQVLCLAEELNDDENYFADCSSDSQ